MNHHYGARPRRARRATSVAGPTVTGGLLGVIVVAVVMVVHSSPAAAADASGQAPPPQVSVSGVAPQPAPVPSGYSGGQDASAPSVPDDGDQTRSFVSKTGPQRPQVDPPAPAGQAGPKGGPQPPQVDPPAPQVGPPAPQVGPPAPVTGQVGPIGPDGLRATDPPGSTVDPTAPPVPVNGSDTSGTTSKNDPAKDQTSKKSPGGDR